MKKEKKISFFQRDSQKNCERVSKKVIKKKKIQTKHECIRKITKINVFTKPCEYIEIL